MNIAATMDNWRISDEDAETWLSEIEATAQDTGAYFRISADHAAIFHEGYGAAATSLLITFESMDQACHRPHRLPIGLDLCTSDDPSRLVIVAKGRTWFRDAALTTFFTSLHDDQFFSDFERHVFYGAAMGGYGAACYSRYAPGSVVITTEPVATLAPLKAPWEKRFPDQRRRDFNTTDSYAPECAATAASCIILHRDSRAEDVMHASLFNSACQHRLPLRFLRQSAEEHLEGSGALEHIISAALMVCPGDEDLLLLKRRVELESLRALRLRRTYEPYLRYLFARLNRDDRSGLLRRLYRHGETVDSVKEFFQRKRQKSEHSD